MRRGRRPTAAGTGAWVIAERSLRAAVRRLRRRVAATAALVTAAAALAALATLAWIPAERLQARGSPWPLAAGLAVAALSTAAAARARRARRGLDARVLAAEAERATGLAPGELRGALELEEAGEAESAVLARLHRERVAEAVWARGGAALFPEAGVLWRRRFERGIAAAAGATLFMALTAAIRPGPAADAARSLAGGWRIAFPPPLPPLVVRPGDAEVPRGEEMEVRIRAIGRERVTLVWRAAGVPTSRVELGPGRDGWAGGRLPPVDAPGRYWATAPDGSTSDTFTVRPLDELLVQTLRVRVLFPTHLAREPELHRRPLPELLVPEGSRIEVEGRTSRPLRRAGLRRAADPEASAAPVGRPRAGPASPSAADLVELSVDGDRFRGSFVPAVSGRWRWELEPAADAAAGVVPPEPLSVAVARDAGPSVAVVFPGRDTLLGAERTLPLIVDASDDIGLRRVELLSWLGGGTLATETARVEELPDGRGERRAVLRPVLDLRDRELLPGDTVLYLVRAFDGHPAHPPAVTDTFRVAIGSLAELRAREAGAGRALAAGTREARDAAGELARAAREAARRAASEDPARPAEGRAAGSSELGFGATQEGRGALLRGEELAERLHELEEEARRLAQALEAAALADPDLAEGLRRLEELYQELRGSELGQRLERLEAALRTLERGPIREALAETAANADALRERLERSLGVLERAALAQEMAASRAEAERLAGRQRALTEQAYAERTWAGRERVLAQEVGRLAERLEELERRLGDADAPEAAGATGEARAELGEAVAAMEAAAGVTESAATASGPPQAGAGRGGASPERAAGAAEEAAGWLDRAAGSLAAAEEAMDREGRGSAIEALRTAWQEALALAAAEAELGRRLFGAEALDGTTWQARQGAVRRGLDNLRRELGEAGRRTALVDERAGPLAAALADEMEGILSRLAESGGRRRPFRDEVDALTEGLNDLALRLLRSEAAVRAAGSSTGTEAAIERMASLAQRQGALAERTGQLASPGARGGDRDSRLRRLADEQAEVGRRLRELAGEELLGRPGEMAEEAERLARRLASGRTDEETWGRQRRLFRRMLDAGRSLVDDRDLDPTRRESRTAGVVPGEPPATDPGLYGGPLFPHPADASLQELPVAHRRLVFEYFDRLNGTEAPARLGNGDRP